MKRETILEQARECARFADLFGSASDALDEAVRIIDDLTGKMTEGPVTDDPMSDFIDNVDSDFIVPMDPGPPETFMGHPLEISDSVPLRGWDVIECNGGALVLMTSHVKAHVYSWGLTGCSTPCPLDMEDFLDAVQKVTS